MKILKIAFKNINSLRGEHKIDFTKEPFLQNSLFAITGPTGSGKTTILDVISLALFNQVPRLGKMSTTEVLKKGAILTRNQSDAFAEITYQCKDGIFASKWEISTNRNGKLRDYHMEIANVTGNTLLDLKKSDVPAKNEELIGLNYDQFIKSVVLAQGEFAKFLQVPKKERGALLEKITGTEIYRRIGQEVFLKHKERAKEIDAKRAKIETYKEQLLEEAVFAEKQQEAEKLATEKKQLQQELERLAKELDLKNKLQKEENELKQTMQQLESFALQKEKFDTEKGEALKRHQEVQLFGEELNQWQSLQNKLKDKKQEISVASEALQQAKEQRETLTARFKETFQLAVTPDNFLEKVAAYKNRIRTLITERSTIAATYKTTKTHIETLAKPLKLTASVSNLTAFQEELKTQERENSAAYQKLEQQFDLANQSVEDLQNKLQQKLRLIRQAEKAHRDLENQKSKLQEQQNELKKLQTQSADLPDKLSKLKSEIELKEAQLEAKQNKLEVEQLQKQLEDFRRDLKPDEACPLCGALHHPFAAHLPLEENGLKKAVSLLEQELKILNKSFTEHQTALRQFTQQSTDLQQRIQVGTAHVKTVQSQFKTQFKTVLKEIEKNDFTVLENTLEKQEQDLAAAKKLQDTRSLYANLKAQTQELQTLIDSGIEKKKAITDLFKGENFEQEIGEAETSWNSNEQNAAQQNQLLKAAEETSETLKIEDEKISSDLLSKLKPKGYDAIEAAIAIRLNATQAQAWAHENQELENELLRLKALRNKLVEEIKTLTDATDEIPLEELQEQQKIKAAALTENEKLAGEITRTILNQKQYLDWISDLKTQIDKELKDSEHWLILKDLIGDSKGDKFNDFAQDLTLAQLLQLANKRLTYLTDRYRIDQPTDDEDDSLVAIDEHMGGQRRSIKTLSGGETFILSLALALALSDLASRNIEINSLFIDEGFGTLDPETLDQTLDTLEVLQAESSKMIGVISHVDSLKERIATQIQLTQNGQGYSSLKVV